MTNPTTTPIDGEHRLATLDKSAWIYNAKEDRWICWRKSPVTGLHFGATLTSRDFSTVQSEPEA